jgi:polar amino acid transport system permease protein
VQYTLDFAALLGNGYPALILKGLVTTLVMTAIAWSIAFLLGSLLAVGRASGNRTLDAAISVFIAFHRNVPMLVHVLFWYFGIGSMMPPAVNDAINRIGSEFVYATLAIGVVTSAYICEDLRSAIRAIPSGQMEAARSLGLNGLQAMRRIILPQAFTIAIPPLTSATLLLFKNTSLAMAIGLVELTGAGREIESATFKTFEVYAVVTVLYLAVSLLMMFGGDWLARSQRWIRRRR